MKESGVSITPEILPTLALEYTQGSTLQELKDRHNLSPKLGAISTALPAFGVEIRPRGRQPTELTDALFIYAWGRSTSQVAMEITSNGTPIGKEAVRRYLKRKNITLRPSGRQKKTNP